MSVKSAAAIVSEIEHSLGRSIRVLHIGNIANNAYNNAKIQRQYGIEADVLCYDYYHVMATPEWEDGGLTDAVDPALPDWWATNLNGFKRPDWYVQGPLQLCLLYLQAYRAHDLKLARTLRSQLAREYRARLKANAWACGEMRSDPRSWRSRVVELLPKGAPNANPLQFLDLRGSIANVRLQRHVSNLLEIALWPNVQKWTTSAKFPLQGRIIMGGFAAARKLAGRRPIQLEELSTIAKQIESARPQQLPNSRVTGVLRAAAGIAFYLPQAIIADGIKKFTGKPKSTSNRSPTVTTVVHRIKGIEDNDGEAQVSALSSLAESYHRAFWYLIREYDIIQGYSVDGFIPLVCDHPAFASYEHGTLRDIPFERSLLGLQCRVAYLNSPAVFVTNTDVLPSVARLGLDPKRVHYIPHAFDDQKLRTWREANEPLNAPADKVVFFSPTRQHWTDENKSLTKGNDKMLRAASRLRAEGYEFKLKLVAWGNDLEASKALIDSLDLTSVVTWVPPMGKQDLWRTYCTSHAVLDQFILPALGGVGFEALALGCRLITRTDRPILKAFFGESPPALDAGSDDDVYRSMLSVLSDPEDQAGVGAASRKWITDWHSAERTVAIQAGVYQSLLESAKSAVEAAPGPDMRLDEVAVGS